jgi:mono/diheme cytochrome c family protein
MMKTKLAIIITAVTIYLLSAAFRSSLQQPKVWVVPDKYVKMANPVASNAESLKDAKDLWIKHCQSCHGKTGKGDGPKASELKTEPGNFTLPATQKQPDGSLFYKISEGREDMPSFKKKIPEQDDIWNLVNYVRTLKG